MRCWTRSGDIRAMDAEDARSISIARIIYEKKVCSVIFLEKFLSPESLSWSAVIDLDVDVCGICGCNDGDWSCCDGSDNGCNDGDECSDECVDGDGSDWLCLSSREIGSLGE